MSVRVSTIRTTEELRSIGDDWSALLTRTRNDLPFLLPEWNITWWEVFRKDSLLIRDRLCVKVARDASGTLVGVVPLMLTKRPSIGPVRAQTLQFLGADPYITEQSGPIVDPACAADVGHALAEDLLQEKGWDWIDWQGLGSDSPFALALGEKLPLTWGTSQPGNLLRLASTWDEFRRPLKRNIKESLRHCYNSLKRDGLTATLNVAETPSDVDSALDVFFRLHEMRATSTAGIPLPDRFGGTQSKRFLRIACGRMAERQIARVFTLNVDGTPVAARIAFVVAKTLYLYYSGFDPAWGKYSVMPTAVAEIIKYAIESGLPAVHLSMGADTSKARWGPEQQLFHYAQSIRPRLSSRAALGAYSFLRTASGRPRVRRALDLFMRQFN